MTDTNKMEPLAYYYEKSVDGISPNVGALSFSPKPNCIELVPASALAAAQAEIAKLHKAMEVYDAAFDEWMDKTAWIVKEVQPKELGMHRADIARQRFEAEQAKVRELVLALQAADMTFAENGLLAYHGTRKQIIATLAKYGDKNE